MASRFLKGSPRPRSCDAGVTLVELLVAMAVAGRGARRHGRIHRQQQLVHADTEAQAVEDALRFAGFVVKGIVRQAGYADYAPDHVDQRARWPSEATRTLASSDDPLDLNIVGASNTRVGGTGNGYGRHNSRGVNGSDSLRVRFFGRSRQEAMAPSPTAPWSTAWASRKPARGRRFAAADRAWSFFYVAEAADGEPELYCKYRSDKMAGKFKTEPMARGIEVFKIVYGHDGNGDGVPSTGSMPCSSKRWPPLPQGRNDEWRKVVGLRIGMVARSAHDNRGRGRADEVLYPLGTGVFRGELQAAGGRQAAARRNLHGHVAQRRERAAAMKRALPAAWLLADRRAADAGRRHGAGDRRGADVARQRTQRPQRPRHRGGVPGRRSRAGRRRERCARTQRQHAPAPLSFQRGKDAADFVAGCGGTASTRGCARRPNLGSRAGLDERRLLGRRQVGRLRHLHRAALPQRRLRAGHACRRAVRAGAALHRGSRSHRGGWQVDQLQSASAGEARYVFRVTAIGYGMREETQVVLQTSLYKAAGGPGCPS
jgi:type IV pilus assembly protein PilW